MLVVHAFLWGCLSGATSENQFNGMLGVLVLGVVVDDVVAVSAVLRMHDSRATTFGSRCFNKSVIFGIQICF